METGKETETETEMEIGNGNGNRNGNGRMETGNEMETEIGNGNRDRNRNGNGSGGSGITIDRIPFLRQNSQLFYPTSTSLTNIDLTMIFKFDPRTSKTTYHVH